MKLVYVGEDLAAIGFRKIASLYPEAEKIIIPEKQIRYRGNCFISY